MTISCILNSYIPICSAIGKQEMIRVLHHIFCFFWEKITVVRFNRYISNHEIAKSIVRIDYLDLELRSGVVLKYLRKKYGSFLCAEQYSIVIRKFKTREDLIFFRVTQLKFEAYRDTF